MSSEKRISVFYANVKQAAKETGKTVSALLPELKEAGIGALDVKYPVIAEGIPTEIRESGMYINSIYGFFDFTDPGCPAVVKKVIDLAASSGAGAMLLPAELSGEEAAPLKAFSEEKEICAYLDRNEPALRTLESLSEAAMYGKLHGVPVSVENFGSSRALTQRRAEIGWFLSRAPELGFTLDTGNAILCGEDIGEHLRAFGGRTVNVHAKDYRRTEDGYAVTAFGKGEIPVGETVKKLLSGGYSGRFAIEVYVESDTLDAVLASAEYLQTLLP